MLSRMIINESRINVICISNEEKICIDFGKKLL